MSRETIEWLNTYTLQSRRVWHTDANIQKVAQTVYDGAIPVADVISRLFAWDAVEADVTATATIMDENGVGTITITDPERKAMLRPPGALGANDKGAIMGVFKSGYQGHSYADWLVHNVANILDDDLSIYSAGLLRGGAQAWVNVTVPDTITTPEGVEFRPNLLAVTSFDGSLATTYKRTVTATVCDNTMSAALGESKAGGEFKVKHSRHSKLKLMEARDALALVHTIADDFAEQVAALTSVKVSDAEFDRFLESIAPTTDANGIEKTGRGLTMAENKHAEMRSLWRNDGRVAPWKNTAYGVVAAVNTHSHWVQTVRGAERDERNMNLTVTGGFDKLDAETLDTLTAVLA